MLDRRRWNSVHSIGYDNEYEFASEADDDPSRNSSSIDIGLNAPVKQSVGANADFIAMDADEADEVDGPRRVDETILDARGQVTALSRDIQKNFGEYNLATFSDLEV